jgi:thioredoxin reductase (NADPH)
MVALDEHNFILTGPDAAAAASSPFQTSQPGIFAVGDVRSGSVKRVASAVGEGSVVVSAVHRYLAEVGTGAQTQHGRFAEPVAAVAAV